MWTIIKLTMSNHLDHLSYFAQPNADKILLSYKGPLNNALVAEMSDEMRNILHDNHKAKRKIYAIFLELVQNMLYYSAETNQYRESEKVGLVLLSESEEHYLLATGNLIGEETKQLLQNKQEIINGMDEDHLRKYRLELVENPQNELSKGAGIGLVKIAITSQNPLWMSFDQVSDDFYFYTICVKIIK
jgi:hypothetical protein